MTPDEFKEAREFLCLNQTQMAEDYGYSGPSKINNYEGGSRPVPRLLGELLKRDVRLRKLHHILDSVISGAIGAASPSVMDLLEDMRAICLDTPETEDDPEDLDSLFVKVDPLSMGSKPASVKDGAWRGRVIVEDARGGARFFYLENTNTGDWFRYDIDPRIVGAARAILINAIELKKGGA